MIHVKGDDFTSAVNSYISTLKKAKKNIDVSHLPEPRKLTTKQGIRLSEAFSYVEGAKALMDKASENLTDIVGGPSKGRKSK